MMKIPGLQILILCILLFSNVIFAQNQEYDLYGGRIDLPVDEGADSGYFRLGEIDGKHFLVTPEGNAFKAIGLNHTHMNKSKNYDEIISNLKALGFNSGDYQGPQWQWNRIPYSKGIQILETSTWLAEDKFKFEDVFDTTFLMSLETKIKNIVQPQANNKMLICYFLTDVPVWEIEKYGSGWIDFYKALDENSEGGKKWSQWKSDNPNSDEVNFILLIAKQLYSEATGFIRKYDKNHLIFSDRYIEYHFPENVVYEVLPYVDGIAIQPKSKLSFDFFEEVYEKYKKPIFVADHVSSYATNEYANTMGQVAQNVEDYLDYYKFSVNGALSKPYIIGYNKCQYMDQVNGTQLKQGLYNENGEPYPYLDSLSSVHHKALVKGYAIPDINSTQKLQDWGAYENIKLEAVQRIEEYRKGDVQLKVILPNGEIAQNTEIRAKLKRHDFKWGAVVKDNFVTSPHVDKYKEIFLKYFNASGFSVACKPKFSNASRGRLLREGAMPWFLENDIYVRGHALQWEGRSHFRPQDVEIYDDQTLSNQEKGEKLLESCKTHFTHAISIWDVKCWDVTNESLSNNAINDLLPDYNTHAHWFKLADSLRKENGKENVVLYANDFQIISAINPWALNAKKDGYQSTGRPAIYREILDEQIAAGAPIEGIGFQSRLKQGLITPDSIYKRLCDFDRFDLPYQATEFEIRDDKSKYVYTDEERRLLTEYMMVMYFSHPRVNGFWHWTFADRNTKENLDYPLFNTDGTPKVNGQIWMNLMDGFLTTDISSTSNADGEINLRGYYGDYQIIVEDNGKTFTGTFKIDSTNTSPTIVVNLTGDPTSSVPAIKKKQKNRVLIRQNINQQYVEVQTDLETLQTQQVQIEFYDFQGRKLYQKELTNTVSRISTNEINGKGLSVVVVWEKNGGTRLATEKISLL